MNREPKKYECKRKPRTSDGLRIYVPGKLIVVFTIGSCTYTVKLALVDGYYILDQYEQNSPDIAIAEIYEVGDPISWEFYIWLSGGPCTNAYALSQDSPSQSPLGTYSNAGSAVATVTEPPRP